MRMLLPLMAIVGACAPAGETPEPGAGAAAGGVAADEGAAPLVLTWAAPAGGAYHAMGAEGLLELDGRCLYLRTSAYRFLLVFPEGTSWDAAAGGIRMGDQLLRPGSRIAVSGDNRSGAEAVAPGFDAGGCDASRVFRVAPWLVRQES